MSSPRPSSQPTRPLEIEITIVSAKHLKNVNWRHGDLKPYAVAYIDPDRRSATKPDDSGSTRPVWNERLLLPFPSPLYHDSPLLLTLEIFHSKPSETPKPLVGTARSPLHNLIDINTVSVSPSPIHTLNLHRPSGRSQGKIRFKLAIQDPNYLMPPPPPSPSLPVSYYYTAPPQPHRDYRSFSYGNYSDHYSPYYSAASGYYSAPPVRASGYGLGPSAPVDYSSYEQKQKGSSNMRFGAGLGVGAVAGALGGMALEEGVKHEEGKIAERVEGNLSIREDYNDY